MTIRIKNASHEDCQIAAGVAGQCKVVSCPNPADAASPVHLHAGANITVLGQSADFRHCIKPLGEIHSAAVVQSWWDNDAQGWYTTIDGIDSAEDEIRKIVRQREIDRTARQAAEQAANDDAARQQDAAMRRRGDDYAMSLARQAGEQWAPGRVAVKISNDRQLIVGRWDDPCIPGNGKPDEVRRAVRSDNGSLVLVDCLESYRYVWA